MSPEGRKLNRDFYLRPTLDVARDLLCKTIVYHAPQGIIAGDIVEVEAYIGEEDPACHAAVGRTARNEVMYGPGGFSYIYFIYGMYNCFNVVTEREGFPAAVLIRAVEPVGDDDLAGANRESGSWPTTNGPGKFCRAFGLTRKQSGRDLTGARLYIIDRGKTPVEIVQTTRIGIKKGIEKPWRFFDAGSTYVSVKKRLTPSA